MSGRMNKKTPLKYTVHAVNNVRTGKKSNRAFVITNETISLDRFCRILSEDYGAMLGKELYIKGFISSIMEAILEQLKAGNVVSFDNYFRFSPSFKGGVDPDTGKPDENTALRIVVQPLKKMKLSIKDFSLVNQGKMPPEPKISFVYAIAQKIKMNQIMHGVGFCVRGRNLTYHAELGDKVTLTYKVAGKTQSVEIVPKEKSLYDMEFDFPAALNDVPYGTKIEIAFHVCTDSQRGMYGSAHRKVTLVCPSK